MQIPSRPYYTISSTALMQQYEDNKPLIDESVRLNIMLDIPVSRLPVLFKSLNVIKNNYIFSLPASLASDCEMLKALLPSFYMLASLDNFSATGETIIPVLRDHSVQPAAIITDLITNYFYDQGIKNLQLPIFNLDQPGVQHAVSSSFCVYDMNACEILEPGLPATIIISFAKEPGDLAVFNDYISRIKTVSDPGYLSENYVEKKIFEEEIQNWQSRVLLYRSFLDMSKSVQQKEYYEVLDWYHKEYETLPRWYKQFGQIIKVIMGKRSFGSLFNDNIKKYKD
ncbi:MAG: hypothetical protein ABIR15_10655 [Chitinophagaceae bacterium]